MPTILPPTATTFQWADDVYTFDLKLGQIRELEEKCKASVFVVLGRLFRQEAFIDDIRETIRLGLIGGGTPASRAWVLVSRYVEGQPLAENLPHAMRIMGALAYGAPQEAVEDSPDPTQAATPTGASTSPPSMAAAPSSASLLDKSTTLPSGSGSPSSKAGTKRKAASKSPSRPASPNTTIVSPG